MILNKLEEYKLGTARRVRFGASSATTESREKHFVPSLSTPALPTMDTIDEHTSAHPPTSPDMQPSKLSKSNMSMSSLMAPMIHVSTTSGSEYSKNSNHTVLIRTASVRSDESDGVIPHSNTDISVATNDSLGASLKQQQGRHSWKVSEAGTVILRTSSILDQKEIKEINQMETTPPVYVSSPAVGAIEVDMHNDLDALVESLRNANYEESTHFDEYHEALVSITTHWDRDHTAKRLKYMNATHNYSNWVILDLLGVLNAQMGNTDLAIKFHSEAIAKSSNRYIEAMHNYAYLLHRLGDEQNDLLAVKLYKMALKVNDSFAHCWLHYGNLLEDAGKLKEAAELYRKAIEIRPTNAAFHLDLANVLDDLGLFRKATESYRQCIELQPNDPVYHWNYGISLENQCFYHKAEDAYKCAINLDPMCIDAHLNYAHMLETQVTPQHRKAMKEYEILLEIPEMAQATDIMGKLARLYDRFGAVDKAEEMYIQILRLEPENEEAYIEFAAYLTRLNRIEDANACFQAGLRHVQTPKLQDSYIQFLKDINNVYNRPQNRGGVPHGATHKMANSKTYALRRTVAGNMRSPTTLSSSSSTTVSSTGSNGNAPMGGLTQLTGSGGGYGGYNKPYVPPSPFISTTKAPSPAPPPAAARQQSAGRNGEAQRGVNGMVTTVDEQGCIVM